MLIGYQTVTELETILEWQNILSCYSSSECWSTANTVEKIENDYNCGDCLFVSGSAVKRKLHNLRTAYGREKYLIEKHRCMNKKPSKVKRWCHYQRLQFLDEVFSPKAWVLQVFSLFFCDIEILMAMQLD